VTRIEQLLPELERLSGVRLRVWRFDGRRLRIDVLAAEGYVAVDASPTLGIAAEDVVAYLKTLPVPAPATPAPANQPH